jgi:opacity protein-like surface antigen
VTALVSAAYAGPQTYSGKEMKQAVEQTPCPQWYADNEWNVGIWGTYAPTVNEWETDTFLGVDHGWGGGIDAKYFFRRYFGLGVQGFGLSVNRTSFNGSVINLDDDNSDWVGGMLGTITFRYPIPCSRFAPYAWAGVGGIWGGGDRIVFTGNNVVQEDEDNGRIMGQYGAGFEVRFTPHIGLINDVSYNHLEGGRNDFLMVRSGVNFAF